MIKINNKFANHIENMNVEIILIICDIKETN